MRVFFKFLFSEKDISYKLLPKLAFTSYFACAEDHNCVLKRKHRLYP